MNILDVGSGASEKSNTETWRCSGQTTDVGETTSHGNNHSDRVTLSCFVNRRRPVGTAPAPRTTRRTVPRSRARPRSRGIASCVNITSPCRGRVHVASRVPRPVPDAARGRRMKIFINKAPPSKLVARVYYVSPKYV